MLTYTFIVMLLSSGVWYEAPGASSAAACEVQRALYDGRRVIEYPGEYPDVEYVVTSRCYAVDRPADGRWRPLP
jgi:hypothetical protein